MCHFKKMETETVHWSVYFSTEVGNTNMITFYKQLITDGAAVPVTIYDPSNDLDSFIALPGQNFMWQGDHSSAVS